MIQDKVVEKIKGQNLSWLERRSGVDLCTIKAWIQGQGASLFNSECVLQALGYEYAVDDERTDDLQAMIGELYKIRSVTLDTLVAKTGISKPSIWTTVTGERSPTIERAEKIIKALGHTLTIRKAVR